MTIAGPRAFALVLVGSSFFGFSPVTVNSQTELPRLEPRNFVMFSTTPPAETPRGAEMRERLADPVKREQLRAETRVNIQSQNPEIVEVLGIDAALEAKLIDVLTDQQMEHLERFWGARPPEAAPGAAGTRPDAFMFDYAEAETRGKQQIRGVLGEDFFYRYLAYTESLAERRQVVYFDGRLQEGDKLSPDQKARLMPLLRAAMEQLPSRRGFHSRPMMTMRDFSPEAMQKQNIELNEESYRFMQEDSRALLQKLRDILTPRQLDAYAQMETGKLAAQRKHVQQMRESAGMTPEFDESRPPARPPERKAADGKVRLELYFKVDENEPFKTNLVIENGRPTTAFQVPGGLWIEATATLFEDDWAQVSFTIHEERAGQRHRIKSGFSQEMMASKQDALPLDYSGGSSTVSGIKAYVIRSNARVSRAE